METQSLMKDKRILLVDDEEKILEILAALLRREGCHITTASSGEQAVALAEEHSYNLVITDMQMPGLSWEPLLEKLRAVQPDTPIILLTALDDPGVRPRGLKVGATTTLRKPSNPAAIVEFLDTVLARKRD